MCVNMGYVGACSINSPAFILTFPLAVVIDARQIRKNKPTHLDLVHRCTKILRSGIQRQKMGWNLFFFIHRVGLAHVV